MSFKPGTKKIVIIVVFCIISNCIGVDNPSLLNEDVKYQSCQLFNNTRDFNEKETYDNRIFVVGHAYGAVSGNNRGMSDNLIDFFSKIEINEKTFLILTGDLVRDNTLANLEKVKEQIELYFNKYYVVPGNHEMIESNNFYNVFEVDFFHEELTSSHIIGANFNHPNWLPTKEDQNKINSIIQESPKNNIILFSHQIFWFKLFEDEIRPNGFQLFDNSLEAPSLNWINNSKESLFVISGDSGAWNQEFFCKSNNEKVTLISNGIGGFKEDVILEIIDTKDGIFFKKIEINNP